MRLYQTKTTFHKGKKQQNEKGTHWMGEYICHLAMNLMIKG